MSIYERGGGFELGRTENKSSKWSERDLNPVPPDIESDALCTVLGHTAFQDSWTGCPITLKQCTVVNKIMCVLKRGMALKFPKIRYKHTDRLYAAQEIY